MIFSILSVTVAGVLGCVQRVPTCAGPSSAFLCLSAGGPASGTPEHGLSRGSAADPAPEEGHKGFWCPSVWHIVSVWEVFAEMK